MRDWIVSSSVLILAVILLRSLFKNTISARLSYALWVLVLIRLLLPVGIGHSPVSIANILSAASSDTAAEDSTTAAEAALGTGKEYISIIHSEAPQAGLSEHQPETGITAPFSAENADPAHASDSDGSGLAAPSAASETVTVAGEAGQDAPAKVRKPLSPAQLANIIWCIGAAAVLTVFSAVNLTFFMRLHRSRREITDCRAGAPVYISSAIEAPCLFGVMHPAIYVTPMAAEDKTMLLHSVEHENTHLRHLDNVWSVLRSACLVIHWYNPLVWIAAILSRNDSELACDEGTLERIGVMQCTAYGMTLIRLTCRRSAPIFSAATTMAGRESFLRQRVTRIVSHSKPRVWAAAIATAVCIVLVGCTFTGATSGSDAVGSERAYEVRDVADHNNEAADSTNTVTGSESAPIPESDDLPIIAPGDIPSLTAAHLKIDGNTYTITDEAALTALSEILSGCEKLGKAYECMEANIFVLGHPYYAVLELFSGDERGYIRISTDGTKLISGADGIYYQYFGSRECIWEIFGARLPFRLLPAPLHCVSGGSDVTGQLVGGAWETVDDKKGLLLALDKSCEIAASADIHFINEDKEFSGGQIWVYDENGEEVELGNEERFSISYIPTMTPGKYYVVSQSGCVLHKGNSTQDIDYIVNSYVFLVNVTAENHLDFFVPEDMHGIVSAVFYYNGKSIELKDWVGFKDMVSDFAAAQKLGYGTACGFGTPMVMTDNTGRRGVVFPAGDDCNVYYSSGEYWETEGHLMENIGGQLNNSYVTEVWDEEGRIVQRTEFLNSIRGSEFFYEYTEDGRLRVCRRLNEYGNEENLTEFIYDADETTELYYHYGELIYTRIYKYESGRIIFSTNIDRNGVQALAEYIYDDEDRLLAVSENNSCTVHIYNDDGLVQYSDTYNEPYSSSLGDPYVRMEYTYYDDGRLKTSRFDIADGQKLHQGWCEYEYVMDGSEEVIWCACYTEDGRLTERYRTNSVFSGKPVIDIYFPDIVYSYAWQVE